HTIKKRHKFSPQDKIYLEEQFSVNPYPSTEDRAQIAQRLGISEKMNQTWFNNARQRQ
ncbi:homeobox protein EgHBX4, partial [Hyaloscypha bicolor E]